MPGSVIITIIVVLGVIIAGGFLMYFCGDLLMGLAGKKKDADVIKAKQQKEKKALEDRVNALSNSDAARKDPDIAAFLYDGAIVEAYNPDEEEEVETVETVENEEVVEEAQEIATEEVETEEATEEVEEAVATEEVEEEEDETAAFIRQRRAELMARLARMQEEQNAEENEEEEEEETDESVDLEEAEESEEVEETEEVEEVEESESTEEQPEELNVVETVETEAVEEPAEEVVEEKVEEVVVKEEPKYVVAGRFSSLTIDELEAKLADEQEKLKENEKDLRQCKKEYIPLKRVKTTLERDENKLRRKEALVAKQKVVLYGVNNYSDIDEEKAKKLAEDLDLLDGLKLSVQHCQEVMDKNEDRYPLLEKIYTLLTAQNEEIKEDIQEIQDAIAKLQNPTDTDAE